MSDRPEASELAPGTSVLGRCVVDRLVRRGSLATVYIARARGASGEWYTVRTVYPEKLAWSERAAEVFRSEMERVREIFHPAIPRLVAFDPSLPAPVMLTAHAAGSTLREIISTGTVPSLTDVVHVTSEVAAALASLHVASPSIVHRTVCPENVIVARPGTGVWLEESGLAHALAVSGMLPDRPTVMAEPGYLVPEELFPPSARSDTFSLAVVAFEYLTGKRPFDRAGPAALALAVHGEAFPRPETLRDDLSSGVHAVFARAWTLADNGGYLSPMAFARDLADALGVPSDRDFSFGTASMPPGDDLDRAFDAMLHHAPSPPTPSIADLARLVAPPTPRPPPPDPSPPDPPLPDPPPVDPPVPLPDLPDENPHDPRSRWRPTAQATPVSDGDRPTPPVVDPTPVRPSARGTAPPPFPPRWPTLRAAGGLVRPHVPTAPAPMVRPSGAPVPKTASTAVGHDAAARAPRLSSSDRPFVRPSDGTDDLTPIADYERVTITPDPEPTGSTGNTQEILVDDLVAVEGSALHRVAALHSGDPIHPPGTVPSVHPPPAPVPSALSSTEPIDPLPDTPAEPPADPSYIAALDDLPQRTRPPGSTRTAVSSSVPTAAPLPAPPPVPAPSIPPGPSPAVSPSPAWLPSPVAIVRAAWILGGSTVVSAVIVAVAMVFVVLEYNDAVTESDRVTLDRPDAAVPVVPVGESDTDAARVTDATLAVSSDLGERPDVGLSPADVVSPDVPDGSAPVANVPGVPAAADAGRTVRPIPINNNTPLAGDHPGDRDRAVAMAQLRPRVADCVEGIEEAWVNIAVRYAGATGQAMAVRLHGVFQDPPIGPCLEQAVRAVRLPRFSAASWETTLSFPIEPPRWHQTEHRM